MSPPKSSPNPRIVEMRARGMSWSEIAAELGITVGKARWGAGYRWGESEIPPIDAIPEDFEVRAVSTDSESGKQWIAARPAREVHAGIQPAIPDGHFVKGVSTLVDEGGNVTAQWIKTDLEKKRHLDTVLAALKSIAESWQGIADPASAPAYVDDDLLCVYPMGDPHFGMYAWKPETGDDFDLTVAERTLYGAVDQLVAGAPPAAEALIIPLGDTFHADNSQNRTSRSGNALDVDTRWAKVLRVVVRSIRRCIDRALEKHARVRVIVEIGNHDDHSAIMLATCLEQYYERDPRVVVDTSPAKFHWYRFGDVLIGTTHGDTVKLAQLPGVMACDRKEDWGQTSFRYFYTGHVHHDSLHEFPGVIVETLRTLAPKDAWAAAAGYRSGQDMRMDVIHRRHGRIQRNTVGISQLRE